MCKLFAIVEIENKENAERFTKKAIPIITKTDNHGLGIMRLGEKGVHIERWLTPPTVLRKRKSKVLTKYEKALRHQQNEEGKISKDLYAIAVHGRFATCDKSLANTHPFYRDGSALMHNGIISNHAEYEKVVSTCDSEVLLSQYIKHGVKSGNEKLTEALKGVSGYYASIVFSDDGTIDIWRDDTASLFLAHVRGVGVVIATTEEIIVATAKKCRAFITGIDEILPYTSLRWIKGLSPHISTFESIKPIEITPNERWAGHLDGSYIAPEAGGWNMDVIEDHKSNILDAKPWYMQDDWSDDSEARAVKEYMDGKEEQEEELKKLYDMTERHFDKEKIK